MKTNTWVVFIVAALLALGTVASAADPTPRPTPIRKATGFDGSVPVGIDNAGDVTCNFSYTVAGGAMSLNDTVGLCKLPKGATLTDWMIYVPTQGTASKVALGIQEAATALLASSTCGAATAGTMCSSADASTDSLVASALPRGPLTADTYLVLTQSAVATTPNTTPAAIKGWVRYHMHGAGAFP